MTEFRQAWRWPALMCAIVLLGVMTWSAQFALRAAPSSIPVAPSLPLGMFEQDAPIADSADWLTRRAPLLREAFLSSIYGVPPAITTSHVERSVIEEAALNQSARLELLTLHLDPGGRRLRIALFTPRSEAPAPLIVLSNFCGLDHDIDARLPAPAWRAERCTTGIGRAWAQLAHGDAILRPPIKMIVARGYAAAILYPGDVAPDDAALFQRSGFGPETGAVAVWAFLYQRAFEALRSDPRIDASQIAFWGHSRYGKAALLAAALEPSVSAVIANQSGAFGATLSSATRGETDAQIVRRFSHWFPPQAADRAHERRASGLDQHLLLALIAPRPVLLGNAGLDRWSDPAAAFAAARAASDVYALFGSEGLAQPGMRTPVLSADISFYVRPGGHGVRTSDWESALDFLDHHFKPSAAPANDLN